MRIILLPLFIISVLQFSFFVSAQPQDPETLPYVHDSVVPKAENLRVGNNLRINLFTGSASYAYPLVVPLGTNDLQQQVTIFYNSQNLGGRPSIVGSGWSISQSYILRNTNYSFDDISDDKFILVLNGA